MHRFKKYVWKVGMVIASMLLLVLMMWTPISAASAYTAVSELATPGTVTMQATPTEDATVTALTKEQLTQQVAGQQHTWGNWLWSNAAAILSSFLSTLVIVVGALLGFWQWRVGRNDIQRQALEMRYSAKQSLQR